MIRRGLLEVFAVVVAGGAVVYLAAVLPFDNPLSRWGPALLLLGFAAFPCQAFSLLFDSEFRARDDFLTAQGSAFAGAAVWAIGVSVLFLQGSITLWTILLLGAARFLVSDIILVLRQQRAKGEGAATSIGPTFWRDFLKLYPNAVFAFVIWTADSLMLGYLSTREQVALYGLAAQVFVALSLLPGSLSYFLMSRTGDGDFFSGGGYAQYSRIGFATCALVGTGSLLAAPAIVHALGGTQFGAAVLPLRILAVGFVFAAPSWLFSSLWVHLERYGTVSVLTAVNGLLNVGMNLYAIPRYGATGAAVTSLASYVVAFLMNATLLARIPGRKDSFSRYLWPRVRDLDAIRGYLQALTRMRESS